MKYSLSRSTTIKADKQKILEQILDFKNWNNWSPWAFTEPEGKREYSGKAGEEGHEMKWDGEVLGAGINTLSKIEENTFHYDLQFLSPFKSQAKSQIEVQETGKGEVQVTWSLQSSMPWYLFWMTSMMKSWIEMDYDRGLTMLKAFVEEGKINATTTNDGLVDFEGFNYVGIQKTCSVEDMPQVMKADFETIMKTLEKSGKKARHWLALYPKINMKKKEFTFISACSDEDLEGVELGTEFARGAVPSQKMLKVTHKGSYRFLGNAWSMGTMHLQAKKMKQKGAPFEYYKNSPLDTEESQLHTEIYFPIKS